jgi:CDGSH-type Zn-finger protein
MDLITNEGLPRITAHEPIAVTVEPGKIYKWCSCGLTETSPFCDNNHRKVEGTPFKSVKVMFDKSGEFLFCQCKKTKTPPFCDDSCKTLNP